MIIKIEKYRGKQITLDDLTSEFICSWKEDGQEFEKTAKSLASLREKIDKINDEPKLKQVKKDVIKVSKSNSVSNLERTVEEGSVTSFGMKKEYSFSSVAELHFWFSGKKGGRHLTKFDDYWYYYLVDNDKTRKAIKEVENLGKELKAFIDKTTKAQDKLIKSCKQLGCDIEKDKLPNWN